MKNICFFNTVKFWGGGEKFYFEYATYFKEKGYNVYVVCSKNSVLSQKADEYKLPQLHINVNMLSVLNPIKVWKLVHFFKKEKIDTVIFSTSQDLKMGGVTAKLAKVPSIAYRRGLAVPIKDRLVNRFIFKNIPTHIIANSEETKRTILQNLSPYIDADRIKVIYNGIDVDEFNGKQYQTIKKIEEKRKGVVIGSAGRLTAQKGQQYLLEVARILKGKGLLFTIFIAGTGELKEELEATIKKYQLEEEVILLDFVSDMASFMNAIDIFLLPSIWEGFGYVLAEAMILSKPVVAFRITSNPEIVKENVSAFLIDYPDIDMFAEKTMELIENKSLREKMGKEGFNVVHERFRIADKFLEIESYLSNA